MNTKPTPKTLEDRMHEAVSLDHSDPRRLEMLREIVEAGEATEQQWLELVERDERLRLDLLKVDPPSALAERLRELPNGTPDVVASPWRWFVRRLPALAAVVAMAVGMTWLTVAALHDEPTEGFDSLGRFAVDHYYYHRSGPMLLPTSNAKAIESRFGDRVDYTVRLPQMDAAFKLLGATICELDGHDVICTKWDRDGKTYTVYQFCATDHGLREAFERRTVRARDSAGQRDEHDVVFWTENHCAYAMVTDATQP